MVRAASNGPDGMESWAAPSSAYYANRSRGRRPSRIASVVTPVAVMTGNEIVGDSNAVTEPVSVVFPAFAEPKQPLLLGRALAQSCVISSYSGFADLLLSCGHPKESGDPQ